jgi:hypothetical protein
MRYSNERFLDESSWTPAYRVTVAKLRATIAKQVAIPKQWKDQGLSGTLITRVLLGLVETIYKQEVSDVFYRALAGLEPRKYGEVW